MGRVLMALLTSVLLATIAVGSVALPVMAQHARATSTPSTTWKAPRTIDGHPDLQGYWTNDSFLPVERAPELGTKEFFTPDEAAVFFKQGVDRLNSQPRDDIHYDDALWQAENYTKEPSLRTSLIFDPPDGRLPPLTLEASARVAARARRQKESPADSAQHRSLAERCIAWGNVGPPMVPPAYNANFEIRQTRDLVVIRHELMHDVRMIYIDGRPHIGAGVRRLAGDSRGRWDGETLVVDTTNFTEHTNFRGSPRSTRQDIMHSDAMHVVERFTRVAPDRIRYEFTVNDPKTWTKPWSGEMPLRPWPGPIYEYACHEGNYGLANILRGARAAENGSASSDAPAPGSRFQGIR